jgi:hypothetical protein
MQTIPDMVLEQIAKHRPDLAPLIANLRAHLKQAAQIEQALATAYLLGTTRLSAVDTWHLSRVADGAPWGGDWVSTAHAAQMLGYADDSTLRRKAARLAQDGRALKRGKRWFLRRDALS